MMASRYFHSSPTPFLKFWRRKSYYFLRLREIIIYELEFQRRAMQTKKDYYLLDDSKVILCKGEDFILDATQEFMGVPFRASFILF